jgi:putative membrane protein
MPASRALAGLVLLASATAAGAHAIGDTGLPLLTLDPWVVVPLAISAALYAKGLLALWRRAGIGRGVTRAQAISFASGWLVVAIALVSPIDPLAEQLFSVHMVQHELLMVVGAPLLVLGRPLAVWAWGIPASQRSALTALTHMGPLRAGWHWITGPLQAWLLHALALWLWHVPAFFQAALASEALHTFQHVSFLATGLLFWWNALGAVSVRARATAVFFLFTTMIHMGVLGALLTFAESPWYPAYIAPTLAHGLDPLADQQLGGLIMWVPAGVSYVIAAMWVAATYLSEERGYTDINGAVRTSRPPSRPAPTP